MPELGPYGSVRGARGNSRPYRESDMLTARMALLTLNRHSVVVRKDTIAASRVDLFRMSPVGPFAT